MKSFIAALTALCLLIIGGIIYTNYLDSVSQSLVEQSDAVITAAQEGDFSKTRENFDRFKEYYLKKEKILYMLIDHELIATINTLTDAVEKYITCEDRNNTLAYGAMLRFQFINLPQEEVVSFENIV
jgi:hypothetical protein